MARRLARVLKGSVIEIPPELREFYHAACVAASNHLTALTWVIERMFRTFGVRKLDFFPVFRPIIETTLNNIALTSPARALAGLLHEGIDTVPDLASIENCF
jgi:predicted short-subunit dehydrogenase-like oxidoreductase (DUF2520 family)